MNPKFLQLLFNENQMSTIGSRFTTGLRSRMFGCKSDRRKTGAIKWFKLRWVHGANRFANKFYNLQYSFTL
jgi:hypothetical protein